MTSDQARDLFSAAYDSQLGAAEQRAFERALQDDAELAAQYDEFCATLDAVRGDDERHPAPDLLRGVQGRLRNASGGRYYADRFAERAGVGWLQPWTLLIVLGVVVGLLWLAFRVLQELRLAP